MRNIRLAYVLAYLNASWFWFGIWILFYLQFTNYAGIGLIEAVMISTSVLLEIPTGAVADLFGRKRTLVLAFFIIGFGNILMGLSFSLLHLLLTVILINIGYTLHSGTFEALIYDTLKDHGQESRYNQILARINSIQLTAYAISSIIGGFMYAIHPRLPYIAVGTAGLMAACFSLFLKEPRTDSSVFSWSDYLHQTRQGFSQLFKAKLPIKITALLIVTGAFLVVVWEYFDNVLAIAYGLSETQLGIFFAICYLVAAAASQLTPYINKKWPLTPSIIGLSIILAVSLILSPFLGLLLGGAIIIVRSSLKPITDNIISQLINRHTLSRYRATTLSTYQTLTKLPYVITALIIGYLTDLVSAPTLAFFFGILLLFMLLLFMPFFIVTQQQKARETRA